jgi:hypothetical protein
VPGGTVDESFAGRPRVQRDIYEELLAHLGRQGPVHVDAVRVGVFLASDRKLAEVRPQARALSLALFLPGSVEHARIARRIRVSADRTVHVIKLYTLADVDDDLRAWLTEAYAAATD